MAGSDINTVAISGHLAADMRVTRLQSGASAGNFTVATNRYITSSSGEAMQRTAFIDCAIYGRAAEALAPYMAKGKEVFVQGRLDQDKWTKDGQSYSRIRIVCEQVRLSGIVKRSNDAPAPQETQRPAQQRQEASWEYDGDAVTQDGGNWADSVQGFGDIPF